VPAVRARTGDAIELAHRARTMIAAQGPQRLPARDVARRLGCSPSHLSRTFTRVHGMTLTAYSTEMRLRYAVGRLRSEPETDLTEVALACGFSSHSHFTSVFRRHLGVTPSVFAAQLLSGPEQKPASAVLCDRCST
jgi:AraC-like DNA-binding protein